MAPHKALAVAAVVVGSAASARADEAYVGAFAHDIQTQFSGPAKERGVDINVGYRTAPITFLSAIGRPMVYGTFFWNDARRTSYGAIGFQWRRYVLNHRLYGVIGLGGALHDQAVDYQVSSAPGLTTAEAEARLQDQRNFKALGTRFLFNPNLALGVRLSSRWALEAVWSHISNAYLCPINPGLDDFGGRAIYRFGPGR